ncbi:hypothetical protein GCM10007209_23280 [Haloferax sulfurifontis]|uniref:Uncharacterized protein n=1 Tax=Haloferax sulfurifontis TaxID=255616 RepID=A0A830DT52_9EURY|nr:hypothetical protein GCM10007209_23280 [Haloferax sulfurifontis]
MNRANPSLRKGYAEPLSPKDEVSTLASGARAGLTGRARVRSPLKTYFAGREQGLTARPSPLPHCPPTVKGLSTRRRENRGTPSGCFDAARPREVGFRSVGSAYNTPRAYHAPPRNVTNAAATTDQRW